MINAVSESGAEPFSESDRIHTVAGAQRCDESQQRGSALMVRVTSLRGVIDGIRAQGSVQGIRSGLERIIMRCGDNEISGIIDSGAEISCVREDKVPAQHKLLRGDIILRGSFGETVRATLANLPLKEVDLLEYDSMTNAPTIIVCALTNRLAEGIDILLCPSDLEVIRRSRSENRTLRPTFKPKGEQSKMIQTVSMPNREAHAFKTDQREDSNLCKAWSQAQKNVHMVGMFTGSPYHRDAVLYRRVKQFVNLDLEGQNEKAGNKTNKNAESNKKQNKRGKNDMSSEESESEVLRDANSKEQLHKKRKCGSPEQEEMGSKLRKGNDAVGEDGVSFKQKFNREKVAKGKAKKGSNSGVNSSEKLAKQKSAEDFDDKEEESVIRSKSSNKMSAFLLLEVEDMDIDTDIDEESDEEKVEKVSDKPRKKSKAAEGDLEVEDKKKKAENVGKKRKRKQRRKQEEDEEDVDKLLEKLALEIKDKRPPPDMEKSVEKVVLPEGGEQMEMEVEEITKEKRKKKNKEDQEITEKKDEDAEVQEETEGILKTAVQKRREKKERERVKKLHQNAKEKAKKIKDEQPLQADSSSAIKTEKKSSRVEAGEGLTAEPESKADEDEGNKRKRKRRPRKRKRKTRSILEGSDCSNARS